MSSTLLQTAAELAELSKLSPAEDHAIHQNIGRRFASASAAGAHASAHKLVPHVLPDAFQAIAADRAAAEAALALVEERESDARSKADAYRCLVALAADLEARVAVSLAHIEEGKRILAACQARLLERLGIHRQPGVPFAPDDAREASILPGLIAALENAHPQLAARFDKATADLAEFTAEHGINQ